MASAREPTPTPTASEVEAAEHKSTLTPPPSEKKPVMDDAASSSELSDLEEDEDIGEITPDHYYEGGKIPVFKPTMDQFRSFKKFIDKIDKYGMKSGIVKVVPPKEWRDSLPPLDQTVKSIKVKNPITQEFEGTQGTYVQKNIEKQRSYNLPQWRELSEASNHQPPARRGERRRNQDKVVRASPRTSSATSSSTPKPAPKKKLPFGRKPRKTTKLNSVENAAESVEDGEGEELKSSRPLTPTSPGAKTGEDPKPTSKKADKSSTTGEEGSNARGRQPKSVSSRRKYNRREAAETIDEAAFEAFDYRIDNPGEFTPERCEELERSYWKSITYNSPMYGADMPGSLFDETTTSWNVARLENLLDVLGQKIPGVNTAYLYLGMWKSTFAWHLEDVDLYSINYIHFGAPKQWYSISQADARRFEAAMRDVWPIPAKACDQFLRHKTFLISPTLLQSKYNIKVNRLVHHEGEFVITFPYGYHSGYNIGYNCAESVNFATEAWLEYGRVAKKCNCETDSVWVDVNDIERKLRGEETEYEETDVEEEEEEEEEGATNLPTPPESVEGKPKKRNYNKRKRDGDGGGGEALPKIKRIRIRTKAPVREPCVLCPNDIRSERLLPTDNGLRAHRTCALYTPETYIEGVGESEQICNVANIDRARLDLKCNFCRSKRGSCFQCSQKKCTRAYHPTCAAAAGVLVEARDVPVFGEDGTEYTDLGIDFRCRFHRTKRARNLDGDALEESELVRGYARALGEGHVVQMQYYRGDIFAGVVLENRRSERTVLVDVLPKGDRVEVEYKWILAFDPADSHLPVPSANAKPLSAQPSKNIRTTSSHPDHDEPVMGEPFGDPNLREVWSEYHTADVRRNADQVPVDFSRVNTVWHYLGKTSTEGKPQYSDDPRRHRHNPLSNYLDSVRSETTYQARVRKGAAAAVAVMAAAPTALHRSIRPGPQYGVLAPTPSSRSFAPPMARPMSGLMSAPMPAPYLSHSHAHPHPIETASPPILSAPPPITFDRPYQYQPRIDDPYRIDAHGRNPHRSFEQHANGKISFVAGAAPPMLQDSQRALIQANMARLAARSPGASTGASHQRSISATTVGGTGMKRAPSTQRRSSQPTARPQLLPRPPMMQPMAQPAPTTTYPQFVSAPQIPTDVSPPVQTPAPPLAPTALSPPSKEMPPPPSTPIRSPLATQQQPHAQAQQQQQLHPPITKPNIAPRPKSMSHSHGEATVPVANTPAQMNGAYRSPYPANAGCSPTYLPAQGPSSLDSPDRLPAQTHGGGDERKNEPREQEEMT